MISNLLESLASRSIDPSVAETALSADPSRLSLAISPATTEETSFVRSSLSWAALDSSHDAGRMARKSELIPPRFGRLRIRIDQIQLFLVILRERNRRTVHSLSKVAQCITSNRSTRRTTTRTHPSPPLLSITIRIPNTRIKRPSSLSLATTTPISNTSNRRWITTTPTLRRTPPFRRTTTTRSRIKGSRILPSFDRKDR